MKKLPILTLILILSLLLGSCQLPAPIGGGDEPTATATGPATSGPDAASGGKPVAQEPTATSLPPAITDTPQPVTTEPLATPVPEEPVATEIPPVEEAAVPENAARIQFQANATSQTIDGEIESGQVAYYVLKASAGQLMKVSVWSPNSDVYLDIAGVEDGSYLLSAGDRETSYQGSLPATQDYLVSLSAGGGYTSFSITVEITNFDEETNVSIPEDAFDPYTELGDPRMEDPMNGGNIGDWTTPEGVLPDSEYIRMQVDGAKFYVTGKNAGWTTWYFAWREMSDFYLETTFNSGACADGDMYGLIIRGPKHMSGISYGYVAAFTCDGQYTIFRLDGANPYTTADLVSLTESERLNAGANQQNIMGIRAEGDTITVYANGYQLAQVTDARYSEGRYGLFVSPALTTNYTYRVVHMAYWLLDE
ncbi:MAG TPA: hypothetical protein PKM21_13080 [Anaerolineales bacterium]|nr:hypothetical protein [Anaerolineales bacterium]